MVGIREVAGVDESRRIPGTDRDTEREQWLLDWLTAAQLPRFNRKGMLRVVRRCGLGAWLSGVESGLLSAARERALDQWESMRSQGIRALVMGHRGYPFGLS